MRPQEPGRVGDFDQKMLALKHVKFHRGLRKFSYFFDLNGKDRVISYKFGEGDKVKIAAREAPQGAPLVELIVARDSLRIRTREGESVLKKGTKVPETTDKLSLWLLAQDWMSGTTAPENLLNIASELLPPDCEVEGSLFPIKVNINWDDLWDTAFGRCFPEGDEAACNYTTPKGEEQTYIHRCACGVAMCTNSFITQDVPTAQKEPVTGELTPGITTISYSICVCVCMEVG
jgi:hypothetical protein